MKKRLVSVLLILVCVSAAIQPISTDAKTTSSKLEETQAEYEETREQLDESRNDLAELNSQKNNLELTLEELNTKLEAASDILEELERAIEAKKLQIDETWGRIEELSMQISETEEKRQTQYELAKAQIRFAYECGDSFTRALLFGGKDYASYINRGSYLQMLTDYQQDKIKNLSETMELLESRQSEYQQALVDLETEKAELDEYEKQVSDKHQEISQLISDTGQKVLNYEDEIEETEARIEAYEKKLKSDEADIEKLKKQLEKEKLMSEQAAQTEWRDISQIKAAADERDLLAGIIWCEAGNEPYEGKVAVGAVVMNRVMSGTFPNTISGVLYQKGQFTPASSGKLALALSRGRADEECYKAADAALAGVNNIGSCLYFRTPKSSISPKYVIGNHYFY